MFKYTEINQTIFDDKAALEVVKKSTTIILKDSIPTGTGVIVKVFGQLFCLSAAHVFEFTTSGLVGTYQLMLGGKSKPLIGVYLPSKDPYDFIIIKLSPDIAELAESNQEFYPFNDFKEYIGNFSKYHHVTMFGYPTANIETKGKSIFVQPFIFSSPYLRAEQNTSVRMWFNRNKVFRGESQLKQTAPPIFGCSGGGMWHYNEAEKSPVLIGIVHYLSGIESYITGTNILFILGNLKRRLENDSLLK